ncbi:MAG TPA: hypothetical protein VEH84_19515 [Alphaproteobacteria bacterium]|nr:hypothetical protein [Alphaproteobacteria bacterium]
MKKIALGLLAATALTGGGLAYVQFVHAPQQARAQAEAWLAGLPQGMTGKVGDVAYDWWRGDVTVSGIDIRRGEQQVFAVDTLAMAGVGTGAGGLAADSLKAGGLKAATGTDWALAVPELSATGLRIAALPAGLADIADPLRLADVLAQISLAEAEATGATFHGARYGRQTLRGVSGGKIAEWTATDISVEQPEITLRIAEQTARDFDLPGLLRLAGPAPEPMPEGLPVLVGSGTARDIAIEVPGAKIGVASVSNGPFSAVPFGYSPDAMRSAAADEGRSLAMAATVLRSVAFAGYEAKGIKIAAEDGTVTEIASFAIADFARGRLGRYGVDGVTVRAVPEIDLEVDLAHASVSGLDFLQILDAAQRQERGEAVAPGAHLIDGLAARGVAVRHRGQSLGGFDSLEATGFAVPGPDRPLTTGFAIKGATIPSAVLPPEAGAPLKLLGYETIRLDYEGAARWSPAEKRLTLERMVLDLADAGRLDISGAVDGFAFDGTAQETMTLRDAKLVYADRSLAERLLKMAAAEQGLEPEMLRNVLISQVSLQGVGEPALQPLAAAVEAFLRKPGTLTVSVAPQAPLSQADMDALKGLPPAEALAKLGLSVVHE